MVPDDRAVSEVVGFILIFSLLVISFTVYQGVLVPNQNSQIEFDHNQLVQRQMQDLRNAILTTAGTGTGPSVTINLAASYPRRTIASNLGVSSGRIGTTDRTSGIVISNISAVDAETRDYFGADSTTLGPFDSKAIIYEPTYSFYSSSPETVYENSIVYNRFDNGENLTITGQTIIDGRRISLIALNGSLSSASQGSVSLDPEPVSAATRTVGVRNTTGPITITIPTQLSATTWAEILEAELDPTGTNADQYVQSVTDAGPNRVRLVLERGPIFELRIAKIGIGRSATETGPKYVTTIQGDETSVIEGGSQKLVVEVRDRFNNPASNVTVEAIITGSGTMEGATQRVTATDGSAEFLYTAPDDITGQENVEVEVFFQPNTDANQSVRFDLQVLDTDGTGTGDSTSGTTGVGTGQQSQWTPAQNQQTFTSPNGLWTDISRIDALLLNNGTTVTKEEPLGFFGTDEVHTLELDFTISNGSADYSVFVDLEDDNMDGDVADPTDDKSVRIVDETGSEVFDEELTSNAAQEILDPADNSGTDLLDINNYDGGDQSDLDRLKLSNATWITNTMVGRVDVKIEDA